MEIIIGILLILQLISFYLFYRITRPYEKKPKSKGVFLKSIPKKPNYKDVDPNYELISDVLESIKLENWDCEIDREYSGGFVYVIKFKSHNTNRLGLPTVSVRSRIRYNSDDESIGYKSFNVGGENGSISVYNDDPIMRDIIIFLWDYIIKYEENKNQLEAETLKKAIKGIKGGLITLRRDRQLDDLLSE